MPAVFVSHSSADRELVDDLSARLHERGYGAVFLDLDPHAGLVAGRNWEHELYLAMRRCDAVVFLATTASVRSQWCFAELALARSRGIPVFAVRATPGADLPLLADIQWVDLGAEGAEAGYRRLWTGLLQAGIDPQDSLSWDPARSPYPGLRPFAVEDAAVFFGRDAEIRRLVELFQPSASLGSGRWVSLVGPSGSGKSSLLFAGLLPRLQRGTDRWLIVPAAVPGARPVHNLCVSLSRAFKRAGARRSVAKLEKTLSGAPDPSAALIGLAEELIEASDAPHAQVLICLDQAEELITRCGPVERADFLKLLRGAVIEHSPVWVVCTLRSEFLSSAPDRAGISECTDEFLVLEPISRARLPDVIARPAARAGLIFEPGLVERMVEETTGGDALPLLGHTLFELSRRADAGGQISVAEYEALGGVVGALQRRADRVLDELTKAGYGDAVMSTLLRLVRVDSGGQYVSRRIDSTTLTEAQQRVVRAFTEARLLTSGRGGLESSVEVTHEALLRQWAPLTEAIAAEEHSLKMRAELERETGDWIAGGRDPSYLLRGVRLAEFVDWRDGGSLADHHRLEADEADYLTASEAQAERELRRIQRSNRRLRRLLVGLAALLVASVVTAGIASYQFAEATRQASISLTQQLTAQAYGIAGTQPDVALLLGVEALQRAPQQQLLDAAVATFHTVDRPYRALDHFLLRPAAVRSITVSPDGGLLALGSDDHQIVLWDLKTWTQHGDPLIGHSDVVTRVAFSPDGSLLASASADATIRLWDVGSREPRGGGLTGHQGPVTSIVFTRDGRSLLSSSEDGTIRVWDVSSRRQVGEPMADSGVAWYGVSVNGAGIVAATGQDGSLHLWNLATRRQVAAVSAHKGFASGVDFSPDGTLVATSGSDGSIALWSAQTGARVGDPMTGHRGEVSHLAFSPDGGLLVSAGRDGTARLWDVGSRQMVGEPLLGHANAVRGVTFTPDGQRVVSAGFDGMVRLWQVAITPSPIATFRGSDSPVLDLAAGADAAVIAVASTDGTARVWRLDQGSYRLASTLTGHTGWVRSVAISPQGDLVATAGADRSIRLWNAATGQEIGGPLLGHTGEVTGVAFSPDGATMVSSGRDQTLRWWDVAARTQVGVVEAPVFGQLMRVAISPNGAYVASAGSAGLLGIWDLRTRQAVGKPLAGHSGWVLGLAFTPDSSGVASASADGTVRLWDVSSSTQRGPALLGAAQQMTAAAVSPDGRLLLATGSDAMVRLWRVDNGQPIGEPIPLSGVGGSAVGFLGSATRIVVAGDDGVARLWVLDADRLSALACAAAGRNLTHPEWSRRLGDLPYRATCPQLPQPDATASGPK